MAAVSPAAHISYIARMNWNEIYCGHSRFFSNAHQLYFGECFLRSPMERNARSLV
jgi:hypothetical protein